MAPFRYFLERNGLFADMSVGVAWLNAFFSSVTARTAGFNTFDYGAMSGAALLCTMVLMFIGASPGSAGGGVKTSTFGVLVAYSISRWRGHKHLNIFGRTVPQISISRCRKIIQRIAKKSDNFCEIRANGEITPRTHKYPDESKKNLTDGKKTAANAEITARTQKKPGGRRNIRTDAEKWRRERFDRELSVFLSYRVLLQMHLLPRRF